MKGGRKNLKRAAMEECLTLKDDHSIMQVVSLRGSNLIEVLDAGGRKSLALFPAKFHKSLWIKRGSFVVVCGNGREKALESGSKVSCMVSQVLFYEQVRMLQKTPEWPVIFRTAVEVDSNVNLPKASSILEEKWSSSDDEGLPPLEANLNRIRTLDSHSDLDPDSDSSFEGENSS